MEGPFHCVGVDVLQLPASAHGNKYAIVFMDYLTKWPEVFPAKDQSAYTIAKTLVEKVIPRHGDPAQLLSDCGAAFLSKLLAEVYHLMGMKKVNTTAYHPQTDGLVDSIARCLTCSQRQPNKMGKTGTTVCHSSCLPIEAAHRPLQENPHSTFCMSGNQNCPLKLSCAHHQVLPYR